MRTASVAIYIAASCSCKIGKSQMPHTTNRRQFLFSTLAAGVGGAAAGARPCHAVEPVARTAGSSFKLSMAAYSYRDLLQGKTRKLAIEDFIDDCARFGLDGTELTSYYLTDKAPPDYYRQLKAAAFRRGLDVSGTAVGNDFCHPPGSQRDQEIASVKRWIEYADLMDAPVIRIFSGSAKDGQKVEDARRFAIEAIEDCCDHAGKYGVFLALENHGGLTAEADEMLAIVRAVKSPWFGVNVDTGNFNSIDVYGDLAKIAPYALNVQVKVAIHPAGKPREPSDFQRLAAILRSAGYRGYVVLEFEESGDPRQECGKYIEQLRAAFA
jgi:sugar phosphate isomerase/epimerase